MNKFVVLPVAALAAATLMLGASASWAATKTASGVPLATISIGKKADAVASADLIKLVGVYTPADITALSKAKHVSLFHIRADYPLPEVMKVEQAIGAHKTQIADLEKAMSGNAAIKAWLDGRKLNVNRMVAISVNGNAISIYEN